MKAVIEALEKATCGSRELGEAVLLACGWHRTQVGNFYGPLYTWHGPKGEYFKGDDFAAHNPTSSIDAAMKLVPTGATFTMGAPDWSGFDIEDPKPTAPAWANVFDLHDGEWNLVSAQTPALALCIAALRARQGDGRGE